MGGAETGVAALTFWVHPKALCGSMRTGISVVSLGLSWWGSSGAVCRAGALPAVAGREPSLLVRGRQRVLPGADCGLTFSDSKMLQSVFAR